MFYQFLKAYISFEQAHNIYIAVDCIKCVSQIYHKINFESMAYYNLQGTYSPCLLTSSSNRATQCSFLSDPSIFPWTSIAISSSSFSLRYSKKKSRRAPSGWSLAAPPTQSFSITNPAMKSLNAVFHASQIGNKWKIFK